MKPILALLAPAVCLPLALAAASNSTALSERGAPSQQVAMRVEIFGPAGMHVVTNKTGIEETGDRYAIRSELATSAFAGFFVDMKSHAEVQGRLTANAALPESFRSDTRRNGIDRRDHLVYAANGAVSDGVASGATQLAAGQVRGTVDNLTAYFMLERQLAKTGKCALTVPVFDGRFRYDLHFADGGAETLAPAGGQHFKGQATACVMQRRDIAGPGGEAKNNDAPRAGRIWYSQLLPGDFVQPIRMQMETDAGAVSGYLAEVHGTSQGRPVDLKLMD